MTNVSELANYVTKKNMESYYRGRLDAIQNTKQAFIETFKDDKEFVDYDSVVRMFDAFIEISLKDLECARNDIHI